jgi:glutaminase
VDGQCVFAGETQHAFTIQSMSKPFVYALALEVLGRDVVRKKVGVEPTGEAFNSIVELEEELHIPYNPMINAGAITVSALLHHANPAGAMAQVDGMFERFLGRPVQVREDVADSELETGHRNRAIAHLLRHFKVIGDDIEGALELYSHQCSALVDTRELATMAATLANGGVHPITKQRAMDGTYVRDVLSLMFTCGMYDSSGEWAYSVGLPAKSGVSGGIIAVVPGRMGLAVYSPTLDDHGHSVRGVQALQALSQQWGLSMFS